MKAAVFATLHEADFAIKRFGFKRTSHCDFDVFTRKDCAIVISGIGPIDAAVCARFLVDEIAPDTIRNFGSCGGLNKNLKVRDIVNIAKVISCDAYCFREFKIAESGYTLVTSANPVLKESKRRELAKKADVVDMETYGFLRALELSKFNMANFSAVKLITDTTEDCVIHDEILKHISKLEIEVEKFIG